MGYADTNNARNGQLQNYDDINSGEKCASLCSMMPDVRDPTNFHCSKTLLHGPIMIKFGTANPVIIVKSLPKFQAFISIP